MSDSNIKSTQNQISDLIGQILTQLKALIGQSDVMIRIKAPCECLATEKTNFIELVKKGDQVEQNGLKERVERAKCLAFYEETNVLVGVGAIKRPYHSYRDKIFEIAESKAIPAQYEIELGWISIEREFTGRHIATKIVGKLLGKVKGTKIYATTRTNNEPMKRILKSSNFHQSGKEYKSGDKQFVLFLRDS